MSYLEVFTLLDTFNYSNELKLTLINELIYECRRLHPTLETRLIDYKLTITVDTSAILSDEQPSSSSFPTSDDYAMIDM
jgi:hypothetical protein